VSRVMTGMQVKGSRIPDCRSGDGGRVHYVDQGVTIQGQITDICQDQAI